VASTDLRQACLERLELLDLPYGFNTGHLLSAISQYRGKPVTVDSIDTTPLRVPTNGWRIELQHKEAIIFAAGTSKLHQYHILAHELGHIMFDHPGVISVQDIPVEVLAMLGIDPADVISTSGRCSHHKKRERQAELFGSLLRQRMYRERFLPALQPKSADARWEAAFTRPIKERRT
jgi:hypothetical protein